MSICAGAAIGAGHDDKSHTHGGDSCSTLQQLAGHLRSGSVPSTWTPGVLRRHHLLLTFVTLVLTLALLADSVAPRRCRILLFQFQHSSCFSLTSGGWAVPARTT